MVSPVLWMVSTSFKHENQVFRFPVEWIPSDPTIENLYKSVDRI